jgi:hypothetical protein
MAGGGRKKKRKERDGKKDWEGLKVGGQRSEMHKRITWHTHKKNERKKVVGSNKKKTYTLLVCSFIKAPQQVGLVLLLQFLQFLPNILNTQLLNNHTPQQPTHSRSSSRSLGTLLSALVR